MKFLPFLLKNLLRNKVRTTLTLFLMGVIFFFVASLLAVLENFDRVASSGEGQNRLGTQSSISLATLLPVSHEAKIASVPGVKATAKLQWIGAYFRDQKNFFANFAIDHDKMDVVWDDYNVPPDQMAAFKADRRGTLVGPELARRFGWKIGDKVNLTGTIFPFNPELTIRGIYLHKVDDASLFFHMDYFQQALGDPGIVGTFWSRVERPEEMSEVSERIDDLFKNSEYPTETFTEKEFQQQFLSMVGNIKLLFNTVSVCAIFMIVLLAALTMSMSARERVTEIAVLKAIGFPRRLILILMLTEFVLLAMIGGALGVFGAKLTYKFVNVTGYTQGFLVDFGVETETILVCMLVAVLVGLIAGGLPAARSANLRVVDGLRKVF